MGSCGSELPVLQDVVQAELRYHASGSAARSAQEGRRIWKYGGIGWIGVPMHTCILIVSLTMVLRLQSNVVTK